MILKLKRTPGLYVVGFIASGKSTVGRYLAHRLGWNFFDIDAEIEAAEKASIAELLEQRGEAELRRIEHTILRQHVGWIERGRPAVLALGDGTFTEARNRDLLVENGVSIWLDCPFEVVERRVRQQYAPARPLVDDAGKLAGLYDARQDAYRLADVRVEIASDDPEHTVEAILAHPLFK